jgi:prepilin-type N-terminal cleavage/methylation domain-containing protein
MNNTTTRAGERGFTMLEMLVTMVIAVPILGSIFVTNSLVRNNIESNETAAGVAESCRAAGQRLALLARSGLVSTCATMATQTDVNTALALGTPVPTVGQWISPPAGTTRTTFRFQSADGVLSMDAAAMTPVREFQFIMDPGEIANGRDDNGNGMIDEGRLQLRIGTSPVELVLDGVERCNFNLNGRVLTLVLSCARRDHEGHIYRATTTQSIYLRNS